MINTKLEMVDSYINDLLGKELGKRYMDDFLDKVTRDPELETYLLFSSEDHIRILLDDVVKSNVTIVNDTRLARKMYPNYQVGPKGKLVIEINTLSKDT